MKMKVKCSGCEAEEATVFCCADEAALCWECDEKIHSANKVATKHHRVPLSTSSSTTMPKCDICQETIGFFFCLEDRALLCRKCDVAIHKVNSHVSKHRRFLLTGIKVGLEEVEQCGSYNEKKSNSVQTVVPPQTMSKNDAEVPLRGQADEAYDVAVGGRSPLVTIPEWCLDELLGFSDVEKSPVNMEIESTKADDKVELGESEWLKILLATEGGAYDNDQSSCNVDDISWTVPQIFSPVAPSSLIASDHDLWLDYEQSSSSCVADISSWIVPENSFPAC